MNHLFHHLEIITGKHFPSGHNSQREIRIYRDPRGGENAGYRTYPFTPRNFWRAVGMLLAMQPAGWDAPAQEEPLPFASIPPAEWDEPTPEEVAAYLATGTERHEAAHFVNGEVDYQSGGEGQELENVY